MEGVLRSARGLGRHLRDVVHLPRRVEQRPWSATALSGLLGLAIARARRAARGASSNARRAPFLVWLLLRFVRGTLADAAITQVRRWLSAR